MPAAVRRARRMDRAAAEPRRRLQLLGPRARAGPMTPRARSWPSRSCAGGATCASAAPPRGSRAARTSTAATRSSRPGAPTPSPPRSPSRASSPPAAARTASGARGARSPRRLHRHAPGARRPRPLQPHERADSGVGDLAGAGRAGAAAAAGGAAALGRQPRSGRDRCPRWRTRTSMRRRDEPDVSCGAWYPVFGGWGWMADGSRSSARRPSCQGAVSVLGSAPDATRCPEGDRAERAPRRPRP